MCLRRGFHHLDDGWSDDDDAPADDWDDAPKPARRAKKPVDDAEPAVQVRSTRRRPARAAEDRAPEPEKAKPASSSSATEDLLGLGLWDETPAQPAQPAQQAKPSRKPAADDWGLDEDAPAQPAARRAKKVSIDDLFEDAEEEAEPAPAPRRAPRQAAAPAPVESAPVDPFASMDFDFTKQNLSPSAPTSASAPAAKKDAFYDLFSL